MFFCAFRLVSKFSWKCKGRILEKTRTFLYFFFFGSPFSFYDFLAFVLFPCFLRYIYIYIDEEQCFVTEFFEVSLQSTLSYAFVKNPFSLRHHHPWMIKARAFTPTKYLPHLR